MTAPAFRGYMKNNAGKQKRNDKQKLFISEYLKSGNATEAAIKAGYSEKGAANAGYRLLQRPEIKAEIEQRQNKAAEKAEITLESILNELEEARQLAKTNIKPAAMVSASVQKAKLAGIFNEAAAATGNVTVILKRFSDVEEAAADHLAE